MARSTSATYAVPKLNPSISVFLCAKTAIAAVEAAETAPIPRRRFLIIYSTRASALYTAPMVRPMM
jgi:hypothetical protein